MQLLNICTIFWNLESTVLCISSYHAIVSSAIHTNQGGVDKKKRFFDLLFHVIFSYVIKIPIYYRKLAKSQNDKNDTSY